MELTKCLTHFVGINYSCVRLACVEVRASYTSQDLHEIQFRSFNKNQNTMCLTPKSSIPVWYNWGSLFLASFVVFILLCDIK